MFTKEYLSLDTETTSTDAIDAELVGLSFSVAEQEAFYVPISANREEAQKIVNIFKPLYEDESILKIGQNIKYDYEVLHKYGVTLKRQTIRHHDCTLSNSTRASPQYGLYGRDSLKL